MTSLLVLWKHTYPQSFMLIYGFLFELWVLNLNKEKEEKLRILPIIAQCIYDGEDLGHPYIQSTTESSYKMYTCIQLFSPVKCNSEYEVIGIWAHNKTVMKRMDACME